MIRAPQEIAKVVRSLAHRHSTYEVFADFVEMAALAVSNSVDLAQYDKREARYMEIVGKYKPEEVQQFPQMMGALVMGLEEGPDDILGATFHELEIHNEHKGQFFTPYHLCRMMAGLTFDESAKDIIQQRGFIQASEPACGAGAMNIGLADEMKARGLNYQQALHVTAVDLDIRCVHMAYLQLSLLHIPAVVVHGNTLTLEEFGHWYTPAHIMGGWNYKLKRQRGDCALVTTAQEAIQEVTEQPPVIAIEPKPVQPFKVGAQLTLF
ncbi:N-6 DNA methylase [Hymenobacter fodinae]|uniref:SAM-dependent DNA methyltransferase n=1 Tax=Hymenobacter fodinae TaxID=2510796 RepID=A0A4Z0P0Q4_9BACT|nr:N-6 DNA methylase [Hymenobacter fodinae]TGE04603.1 SAM-dependent DNA methyltransferase [Hymenobacter fodinae]